MSCRAAMAGVILLLSGGCASLSPDGGLEAVADLAETRTGQRVGAVRSDAAATTVQARVTELLASPLSADAAVEIAMLQNRDLQARLADVGLAEVDLVRAGRLRNPSIGFSRMRGADGAVEIERSVMFDVLALLTMPVTRRVEESRFALAQHRAAHEVVALAADVRRAFFTAVAAAELARFHGQVQEAADVSSELARRMQQAGNFSRLDRLREQSFLADAVAGLARARHQAVADREHLTRLLGLRGDEGGFTLPDRLPDLPAKLLEAGPVEQAAVDRRLDVIAARRSTESLAAALGLTEATRVVNVLELGYQNRNETGVPRANGYEVRLELPLFDFGSTRLAGARLAYDQSVHRTAALGLQARSEARQAHSAYVTAYELARHYRDEVVPLKKRISEENLLRYNGMLIGVFELLADARDQIVGVTGYVEALRDHWVAETDLQAAIGGPLDSGRPRAAGATGVDRPVTPPSPDTPRPTPPAHAH